MEHMIALGDAHEGAFFGNAPEFDAPARGMWNIVHTGMLIPEAHQIFVCAEGCLRGVVLTAAEMGALERMSTICIDDTDIARGQDTIADDVMKILRSLPYTPKIVLLYFSCMHLVAGCDIHGLMRELDSRLSHTVVIDCYMAPTMRTTITPDAWMRIKLYAALQLRPVDRRSVNIIGNDRLTDKDSELVRIIRENGFILRDITLCKSYDEYMDMASSFLNITYLPSAAEAGKSLLFGKHLRIRCSFDADTIAEELGSLCEALGVPCPDFTDGKWSAEAALTKVSGVLGGRAVAIDYTAVSRPFDLALALVRHDVNVRWIIADGTGEDIPEFYALKAAAPDIQVISAVHADMIGFVGDPDVLAIGQKAAYYLCTDNFVDIVAGGGLFGFTGVVKLCAMIEDAHFNKKDRMSLIRRKGFGLPSPFKQ